MTITHDNQEKYNSKEMTTEEYQKLALRTNAKLESKLMDNIHMALGMQTEAAELSDVFKKHIAYGKDIDWVNIKEELGDLLWYVANMCNINEWKMSDLMETNIKKLEVRFPDKFSKEKANNRNLEIEREILES